jgi:hypothetical protein
MRSGLSDALIIMKLVKPLKEKSKHKTEMFKFLKNTNGHKLLGNCLDVLKSTVNHSERIKMDLLGLHLADHLRVTSLGIYSQLSSAKCPYQN